MAQYFGLSLNAEWNRGTNLPQKIEIGQEFGLRIAKTLGIINKIKQTVQGISNSPLAKGKVMFEIKSPVIAFSAQWYLAKAKKESSKVATIVVIGVDAKPFVEAEFTINVFKLFIESVGNAVCPGAGNVISWVLDKLKKNAGIHFLIIFSGGIYANGRVNINTLYPEETSGEVKVTGKIQITVEFKAWAGAEIGYIGVDGVIKANVETSVTGGIKVGADNQGIYASPIAEFAGIKANFVAIGTIKFGIFKKTYSYEEEAIFVEPDQIPFDKSYIN
ncbi:hypothetical protein ETU08_03315 [Apibacter muscae]|uniref:hypothetical protein n=1 Tax=Apibacter muscae TaxID=2509004 RepID=UPI0011ACCD41|nr:hypothetical protein [Apibacter muscae]TWP31050.1 hypothetical protein ETU08_03315 [Apibacter muscae]